MRPYHIQSPFYKAWVDLDSIQSIYDVQVLPDTCWDGNPPPAFFSIQFAFQDRTKLVETRATVGYGIRDPQEKEEKYKKVIEEIAEIRALHQRLVDAWKQPT